MRSKEENHPYLSAVIYKYIHSVSPCQDTVSVQKTSGNVFKEGACITSPQKTDDQETRRASAHMEAFSKTLSSLSRKYGVP